MGTYSKMFGDELVNLDVTNSLKELLPVHPGGTITIERMPKPERGQDFFMADLKRGAKVKEYPYAKLYAAAIKSNWRKDSHDLMAGYEPVYGDWSNFEKVYNSMKSVSDALQKNLVPGSPLEAMENEDANKITVQRRPNFSYLVESSLESDSFFKLGQYSKRFLDIVAIVCHHVVNRSPWKHKSWLEAANTDFDPLDTATGLPLKQSGDNTPMARLLMAKMLPDPYRFTNGGQYFLESINKVGNGLSIPPEFVCGAVKSSRLGPIRPSKKQKLVTIKHGEMIAEYETSSLSCRSRAVFNVPNHNTMFTAYVYRLITTGLYTKVGYGLDWPSKKAIFEALKKQGAYTYSADFSGMDKHFPVDLQVYMLTCMKKAGANPFPIDYFIEYLKAAPVISPSPVNAGQNVSALFGVAGHFSGHKTTSSMNSIFGTATTLFALESQLPSVVNDWCTGKFVVANLGDDIMFSSRKPLSSKIVEEVCMKNVGVDYKIFEGSVFLKEFYPLVPQLPRFTNPFGRFLQQTFFNEDSYTADGITPPSILWLAINARFKFLNHHPLFQKMWPIVFPLFEYTTMKEYLDKKQWDAFSKGNLYLTEKNNKEILQYAESNKSWLTELVDRAAYVPSSAALLQNLQAAGMSTQSSVAEALALRQSCVKNLRNTATAADYSQARSMMKWIVS